MREYYRLARGAGHSVFRSLAFALFNTDLPDRSAEIKRRIAESEARIKELEESQRQSTAGRTKGSN